MSKKRYTLFLSLFPFFLFGQNQINAIRINEKINIDANLDEEAWQKVTPVTNFLQYSPKPGAAPSFESEVKVVYDDKAIYISAFMHDDRPDSILHELTPRDAYNGNSDWFAVLFDTYRDGNNGLYFVVTAAGVQCDEKYSNRAVDKSWNVVWKSKTQITDKGWVVEMEIPYAALRFPKVENQLWNINFTRNIRRYRQESSWSPIKPEITNLVQQCGTITGIKNIKSPLRLSATPYLASSIEKTNNLPTRRSLTGGMDIKYGINDAFTLDMTLVPDFGQVQFDNKVLNLTPFEVRFDENRPFFTEGTEIFNKGNLFYSRRIGSSPYYLADIASKIKKDSFSLKKISNTNRLINATKLSGRNKNGLGVGFFNAIEAENFAILTDKKGNDSSFLSNPATNYNLLVLDQNLKNNSYISFVNTNVRRQGVAVDANVSAIDFTLRNKKNTYALGVIGAVSQRKITPDSTSWGHKYNISFAKISGSWQWSSKYLEESDHFNPNDLGFLYSPNERSLATTISYGRYKPFGIFNKMSNSTTINYGNLYLPFLYTNFDLSNNTFFLTKKIFAFGLGVNANIQKGHDYFEPRTGKFDYYLERPQSLSVSPFISSDYRKKYAIDAGFSTTETSILQNGFSYYISPRCRINDHFSVILRHDNAWLNGDMGFVSKNKTAIGYSATLPNAIIIGTRNRQTITNLAIVKYSFSATMGIDLRVRQYWSSVFYTDFQELVEKGVLKKVAYEGKKSDSKGVHNTSANFFNIDLTYTWRFAPGSDFFITYKNAINANSNENKTFFNDFSKLKEGAQTNGVSIKLIYFVDYLYFRKAK